MEVNIYDNVNLLIQRSIRKFLKISNERLNYVSLLSGVGLEKNSSFTYENSYDGGKTYFKEKPFIILS